MEVEANVAIMYSTKERGNKELLSYHTPTIINI